MKESNLRITPPNQENQSSKMHEDAKILSSIGQKIISCLSLDKIISTVYEEMNKVMDATSMNLGIFNEATNRLEFPGTMEKGQKLHLHFANLDEKHKLPVVCFNKEIEILINDLQVEVKTYTGHDPVSLSDDGEIVAALIYIPLYTKGKCLGVISVQSFEKNSYNEYHLDLLKNVGNYVSIAIENARLYEIMENEIKERTNESNEQKNKIEKTFQDVKLLNEIGQKITSCLSTEEIIDEAYDSINKLMDASVFAIGIFNDKQQSLVFPSVMEDGEKLPKYKIELTDEKPAAWCFNEKNEIIILDREIAAKKDNRILKNAVEGKSQESVAYLPLNIKGRTIGVITVQSLKKNAYKPYQLDMLRNIASFSAIALDNAGIYRNVEKEVEKRTKEIEDAYSNTKLLSEIGKDIISCLSIDKISETVYDNINKLMIADTFGVALHNEENNSLDFLNLVEHGEAVEFHQDKLDDPNMVSSYCFNKNEDLLINDYRKEHTQYIPKRETWVKVGLVTHSIIYVPLVTKNKVLGVITVQSTKKNAYTKYHLDIVKNIATYTSIAIENAQIYENLEDEVKERTKEVVEQKNKIEKTYNNFTTISEIGKAITSSLSVEEIIETTYDNVNKLMDAAAFGIGVYDKANHRLEFKGAIERGEKLPNASDNLQEDTYAAVCFRNDQSVILNSLEDYTQYVEEEVSPAAGDETVSLIYLPLKTSSGIIGVITVQSFEENAYGAYELNILETLATYAAIAIENASSFENIAALSEIGKEVSSSLDLDSVLNYLYKKVNEIMDAPIFMASSFSKETKTLTYELCMENGERILQGVTTKLKAERDSFAAWVTVNKKEVIIHDLINEYSDYIDTPVAIEGDTPESLIYIPLIVEGDVIGILSIQSMYKNAYSKHHVELLRSLASYVSGAFNSAIVFKQLEAARKEMEQLSVVASETDNAVIIMNEKGDFEWVNKAYTRMTGFTIETLIKECGDNLGTINNEITRKYFDKMLETKSSVIYELSFLKRDGNRIWIHTNLSPVLDKNNEITKIIAIDTDITERKKAEIKIQEKNKDITDSLNYASRIQRAMLPSKDYMNDILPQSFVLYKPRDIVSGDFYWMTKTKGDETMVAVVDCTGHGVPGAFLTIVGNNLLNQIVNFKNITDPSEILRLMNDEILTRFESSSEGVMKDGMDMSICKINKEKTEIQFAGAFSSLYHIRNNELTEIGGSRHAIGTPLKNNPIYTPHTLPIMKGDTIYLSTDGYQDQFGGPRFKKFKKTNFNNTLLATSDLAIEKQRNELNDIIEEWRGRHPQVDDILIYGIAF